MFGPAGYAAARTRYRDVDLSSRVAGAGPHRLIAILFEELVATLDTMTAGLAAGTGAFRGGMGERRARAMSILASLEASLDHDGGAAVAQPLAAIYREARRLIGEGMRAGDADQLCAARALVVEIADAWSAIG